MLMFDNAIFASFIPQIMMVLGFISCIVVPKFTAKTSTDVDAFSEVKVFNFQENTKQEINVAHFSQYQNTNKTSHQIKFQDYFSPTLAIIKINYPDLVVQWKKIEIISTLFSRPPPFL